MTREQLLHLADAHFSCFNVEPSWDDAGQLILCSEHGQDITDQMLSFAEALLALHGVPKPGIAHDSSS